MILPTLFIVSIILFLISQFTPFDPIESRLELMGMSKDKNKNYISEYNKLWLKSGRNLPLFYFSLVPSHYSPTNKIKDIKLYDYHKKLRVLGYEENEISDLYQRNGKEVGALDSLSNHALKKPFLNKPSIRFNGIKNQFHLWFSGILKGDLGISIRDGQPVFQKIRSAMPWTFVLLFWSLILVFMISIPAALFSAYQKGGWFDSIYRPLTLILYSIPIFWLATLISVYFTTNEYHLKLFNTSMVNDGGAFSFTEIVFQKFNKLAPAIICLVLGDLAYLSMLLRSNTLSELNKRYFITAIGKGLTKWKALLQHIFQNTLIPLVTLLFGSIPLAFAGSLIVEMVFGIPGMGRLLYDSIYSGDWYVVYGIVLLIALFTTLSYLTADVLNYSLDTRLKTESHDK